MTEIVFVGTSDAFGAGGRRQSAIALRSASGTVLLDCGLTTNTGLGDVGIARDEIDAILVSHFHGDHFGGIPLLLLAAQWSDRRRRPLLVAGPPGIEQRVRRLATALGHPMEDRDAGFEVRFEELATDRAKPIGPVSARAFPTHHAPESNPHGLFVEAGARSVAYSGDTGWFDGLPAEVAGADLFVCECTLCRPVYAYHLDHQTLVERRTAFDCDRMILTHLGDEMRRLDESAFEIADDGLRVAL